MDVQDRLRHHIDDAIRRLRARVPPDREAALLAILQARDRLPHLPASTDVQPDLVTGHLLPDPGGNLALQLVLEAPDLEPLRGVPDGWADAFRNECRDIARATLVLRHLETGFMGIVEARPDRFLVWITTRRPPAMWRERADIAWWTSWLVRHNDRSLQESQVGYPMDAAIGEVRIQDVIDVLAALAPRAGEAWGEDDLTHDISRELGIEPERVRRVISGLTLDRDNASWHAAVPGIAAAPAVRIQPGRIVLSAYGLGTDPLLFMTRELRRRDPEAYHNAAHLREDVFRQDLYDLFADKRFITSPGRIRIRHDGGNLRTDIDAAVFDRKTGTLGIFELKSQDPYARSTAALVRQRDNLLYANRQVSGVLDWLNRHGADDLLNRIDPRIARTFRVRKVYPFVLGRFLARFDDGPAPDRRAAWGTWPGVLRVMETQGITTTDANPIASLFARLPQDEPPIPVPVDLPPSEIALGEARIVVYPTWAALQGNMNNAHF